MYNLLDYRTNRSLLFKRFGRAILFSLFAAQSLAFLSLTPAHAQINENCVVSILNRTAQVQSATPATACSAPGERVTADQIKSDAAEARKVTERDTYVFASDNEYNYSHA
jgi:hypothetical protein